MITDNKMIAQEILSQLGGNRFIAMTGAKWFVAIENGLQFKLSKMAKNRINSVRITLTPMDEYRVEFGSISRNGLDYKVVKVIDGAYCDMLQDLFTEYTGLYTRI